MRAALLWILSIPLFTVRRYTVTSSDLIAAAVGLVAAVISSASMTPGVLIADNTLLTISMITREALRTLRNNLTFTRQVSRQYDSKFAVEGAKIGSVLNIRKPPRYEVKLGQQLQLQDAEEDQVAVTLDQQAHIGISFTSQDLKLSIDDFNERFLKPAVSAIANYIDKKGLELYKEVANTVGTPGTVPADLDVYLAAGVKLSNEAAPVDASRSVVVSPQMEATLVNALKALFHQGASIASQYTKGRMGEAAGFSFYMDQNVGTHTVGQLGGTPTVNGAGQSGTSLVTQAWTSAAATRIKRGDVFQIADVYAVNPQNRESVGALRDFVATADADSDGAGAMTISFWPPLIASGAKQTVNALPASGAAITVFGHASSHANKQTRTGLAFHKDAFVLASADLPLPGKGVEMAARAQDEDLGISIRMIRSYSIDSDTWPCRLDVLFGWKAVRPELACRVQSGA